MCIKDLNLKTKFIINVMKENQEGNCVVEG